jgi:hypothetical protein
VSSGYNKAKRVIVISTTKRGSRFASYVTEPMRWCFVLFLFLALCLASPAATLQYLTLDDLVVQCTAIVRGTVSGSHTVLRGPVVYTAYTLSVGETWKGSVGSTVDVAVPGGVSNGARQTFAGAPELTPGGDYLVFLWTSKSGLNVIMGLSQGLFQLLSQGDGLDAMVTQSGSAEIMLSATGKQVAERPIHMRLGQFHAAVRRAMGVH